jgi:hypothetical protein
LFIKGKALGSIPVEIKYESFLIFSFLIHKNIPHIEHAHNIQIILGFYGV